MYKITINGTIFHVDAATEAEAIKAVADYAEAMGMHKVCRTHKELLKECDVGESVADYAKSCGLYPYGTNGSYMHIDSVEVEK